MIIKDQRGVNIYIFENLERVYWNNYGEICAFSVTGCSHKLAKYSTGDSAKEVFDEFTKAVLDESVNEYTFPPSLASTFGLVPDNDADINEERRVGNGGMYRNNNNGRYQERRYNDQKRRQQPWGGNAGGYY